jgi:hypothetical protein
VTILDRENLLPAMLARIEVDWDTGCWSWTGTIDNHGYGRLGGNAGAGIHRLMYREVVGEIPAGLDVDHICHNADLDCRGGNGCRHRRCMNPGHLEPVPRLVNLERAQRWIRRGRTSECTHGHQYDATNTYLSPSGQRNCRICVRAAGLAYQRRRRARLKAAA